MSDTERSVTRRQAEAREPAVPERLCDAETTELLRKLRFNDAGLLPVVVQDVTDSSVLMLAWANREALRLTLTSGRATYWSRSRQSLWRKGDTSGHTQRVHEVRYDCDGDTLLFLVTQTGAACHTGTRSCFDTGTLPVTG